MSEDKERGAFYTHPALVDYLVDRCLPASGTYTVLDPSCGDGAFLAGVARARPTAALEGWDICEQAVKEARSRVPQARIQRRNGLDRTPENVDFILGNPPFVRSRKLSAPSRQRLKAEYSWVQGQFDLTIPFIQRALECLKPGGVLGFVLPNKVLVSAYARMAREAWKEEYSLELILDLSDQSALFGEVAAYPIVVCIRKAAPRASSMVELARGALRDDEIHIVQRRLVPLNSWHPGMSSHLDAWAEAVWSSPLPQFSRTLDMREAVHTGNMRQRLVGDRPQGKGSVPLLRGRDVGRFSIQWGGLYLHEDAAITSEPGRYARIPPTDLFVGNKLLLREIAKRPTAAFDDRNFRCLNKAYVVREKSPTNRRRLLAFCSLINSEPFARLYRARFGSSALRGGYLQFKPQWVGQMPMPNLDEGTEKTLAQFAQAAINGDPCKPLDPFVRRMYEP